MTLKDSFFVLISRHAVQHTFISINESAHIRNRTLFSIVAVDNHQLAQIVESCLLSESTFLYREKLLSYIYIVVRHVAFPPHLIGTQRILDGFRFDFNCRRYPIVLHFTILPKLYS